MANKNLFKTARSSMPKGVKAVDATNSAGGVAYAFSSEAALAQYALTGCLNGTYYASDQEQFDRVLEFAQKCSPEFVAKTAVYARECGLMKDMPALLLAYLAATDTTLMSKVWDRVVDSPKMVRNFVQMVRSGKLGRKSLGTAPKRAVTRYLNGLSDEALFRADVGNDPSLQDILKLVHPAPSTKSRAVLHGYLLDKDKARFGSEEFAVANSLPPFVQAYEEFKKALARASSESEKNVLEVPNVPFQLLTALPLSKEHWKTIAARATWNQLRQNINSFARHGVFEDEALTSALAEKLANEIEIKKAKVFPYQLFTAHKFLDESIPARIRNAAIDAADIAVANVPKIDGRVVVCPDVSGSMSSPITGHRKGATSKMRCIDIAALVAAAVLRQNPEARVLPFEDSVVTRVQLNARDSVVTNAAKLAAIGGGGTNCSAPLHLLNQEKAKVDLIWIVSDNESWVDRQYSYFRGSATGLMGEFTTLKSRCPKARIVLNDIQPGSTTQAHDRADILNYGGFSDTGFQIVSDFAAGRMDTTSFVTKIKNTKL